MYIIGTVVLPQDMTRLRVGRAGERAMYVPLLQLTRCFLPVFRVVQVTPKCRMNLRGR